MDEALNYVKKDMQEHIKYWEDWDAINSKPVKDAITNKLMPEVDSFIETYSGKHWNELNAQQRKDFKKKSRKFSYLNR